MEDRSRRWFIYTSISATAALAACAGEAGSVTECEGEATADSIEGPAYVDGAEDRSDVREGLSGTALVMSIVVYDTDCNVIEGAEVEIWNASEAGEYSGLAQFNTTDEMWLRGVQTAGADGSVAFTTTIPAPYDDRTAHIHIKVRADGYEELVTQLYFPQEVVDALFSGDNTPNDEDEHYLAELEMALAETSDGYETTVAIVLA